MAIIDRRKTLNGDDLLGEIRRQGRRRRFEEMLGPEPGQGDAEELRDFLAFLEEQRRQGPRWSSQPLPHHVGD